MQQNRITHRLGRNEIKRTTNRTLYSMRFVKGIRRGFQEANGKYRAICGLKNRSHAIPVRVADLPCGCPISPLRRGPNKGASP